MEYLTFDYRFGPLVISFKFMLAETSMLIVIMLVFFIGFWLQFNAVYSPVCPDLEPSLTDTCICNHHVPAGCGTPDMPAGSVGCRTNDDIVGTLTTNFQLLIMSLLKAGADYGQITMVRNTPIWSVVVTRVHYAVFHILIVLVLLTVVVAVASEAFDRLAPHSEEEWMYLRAKLIRDMTKSTSTPPPFNLFIKLIAYIAALFKFKGMMFTKYASLLAILQERATAGKDEETVLARIEALKKQNDEKEGIISLSSGVKGFAKKSIGNVLGIKTMGTRSIIKQNETISDDKHHSSTLEDVTDWSVVVHRYHQLKISEWEESSKIIPELGYSKEDMEEWVLALWSEMEEASFLYV